MDVLSVGRQVAPRAAAAAVTMVALATARVATAGNDDENLLGTEAALTGGAVTATVSDGSAVYYNPAGIAASTRDKLDVSGSAYTARWYRIPELLTSPSTGIRAPGTFTEFQSIPGALTYVRPISQNWCASIGIFVPRSSKQMIRTSASIPSGQAGVHDDWAFNVNQETTSYRAGPAVAWRVSPTFRTGVSLMILYESSVASAQFAGGQRDDNTGLSSQFALTSMLTKSSQIGAALGWGCQWDIASLRLGLSIMSPAVQFYTGSLTSSIDAGAAPSPGGTTTAYASTDEETSSFSVRAMAPLRARLGIAYPISGGYVSFDADVQPGFDNEETSTHRSAVINARLGGRVPLARSFSIGGGLFTDRSADRAPEDFGESHIDFYGGAVGIEFGSALDVREARGSRELTFSTTLALRYAHGSGELGGLAISPISPTSPPPETKRNAIQVDELTLYLGSGLSF